MGQERGRAHHKTQTTCAPADRLVVMTAPRQILRDQTYLLTRRCTQRQFLLTPSPETNQNIMYCLALAAHHTGVLLHAACFMSNHWHGVVTDPNARLPEFLERFHRLLAKCQNALLARRENFWSLEKTSVVLLASPAAVLEKMAYTLANPTSAGLVDSPLDWPGVISSYREWASYMVERPSIFFDRFGRQPQKIELKFVRPKISLELSDDEFIGALQQATLDNVERAKSARTALGHGVIGAAAVLRQAPTSAPASPAPFLNAKPRLASKSPAHRVQAIRTMVTFLRAYRQAWCQWREGVRDVLFPAGTYALRVHSRVACAPE